MAIEISSITPAVGEIQQNNNGRKKEVSGSQTTQSLTIDKVSLSDGANFISELKNLVKSTQAAPQSKINDIKQKISSGNYADASKIAEGLINNLNITGE